MDVVSAPVSPEGCMDHIAEAAYCSPFVRSVVIPANDMRHAGASLGGVWTIVLAMAAACSAGAENLQTAWCLLVGLRNITPPTSKHNYHSAILRAGTT
eukprot:gene18981-biopygen5769